MGTKKQWTGREKLALVLGRLKGKCRMTSGSTQHRRLIGLLDRAVLPRAWFSATVEGRTQVDLSRLPVQ